MAEMPQEWVRAVELALLHPPNGAGMTMAEWDHARAVAVLKAVAPLIAAAADEKAGNLSRALKEAGAQMDRRYEMGAAAERERIKQLARDCGATGRGDEGPAVPFDDLIDRYFAAREDSP